MLNGKFSSLHRVDMGERIRMARAAAGLTQSEFARKVGVSKGAVSQWENGDVKNLRLPNLFAIEDATGFSARWVALEEGPVQVADPPPPTAEFGPDVDQLTDDDLAVFLRALADKLAAKQ